MGSPTWADGVAAVWSFVAKLRAARGLCDPPAAAEERGWHGASRSSADAAGPRARVAGEALQLQLVLLVCVRRAGRELLLRAPCAVPRLRDVHHGGSVSPRPYNRALARERSQGAVWAPLPHAHAESFVRRQHLLVHAARELLSLYVSFNVA